MDTILLSPDDNIVVLAKSFPAATVLVIAGKKCVLPSALGLGHKMASKVIRAGEKIIKYGVPIGSATRNIAVGDHVHLHNIQSDYLPTFTLEHGHQYHSSK